MLGVHVWKSEACWIATRTGALEVAVEGVGGERAAAFGGEDERRIGELPPQRRTWSPRSGWTLGLPSLARRTCSVALRPGPAGQAAGAASRRCSGVPSVCVIITLPSRKWVAYRAAKNPGWTDRRGCWQSTPRLALDQGERSVRAWSALRLFPSSSSYEEMVQVVQLGAEAHFVAGGPFPGHRANLDALNSKGRKIQAAGPRCWKTRAACRIKRLTPAHSPMRDRRDTMRKSATGFAPPLRLDRSVRRIQRRD
jgi:hypothetical protein